MKFTVMFVFVGTLSIIEGRPFNEDSFKANSDELIIKLPTPLINGITFELIGKIHTKIDPMYIKLSGDGLKKEEECHVIFSPKNTTFDVISPLSTFNNNYNLFHKEHGMGAVPFSLRMVARSSEDSTGRELIEIFFQGNNAGESILDSCSFETFKNLDRITVSGVHHLQGLIFTFPENSINDNR